MHECVHECVCECGVAVRVRVCARVGRTMSQCCCISPCGAAVVSAVFSSQIQMRVREMRIPCAAALHIPIHRFTASCFSWSGINSHARTRAHTHTDASTHKDVTHSLLYITTVPCRAVPHSTRLTLTLVCRRTHTSIQAPIHWVRDRSRPTASAPWSTANVQALYSTATMAD